MNQVHCKGGLRRWQVQRGCSVNNPTSVANNAVTSHGGGTKVLADCDAVRCQRGLVSQVVMIPTQPGSARRAAAAANRITKAFKLVHSGN